MGTFDPDRRRLVVVASAAGAALILDGCSKAHAQGAQDAGPREPPPAVGPTEDLMREHGVLRRILLVYDELARRLDVGGEVGPDVIGEAALIVRRFVEDYHERTEEKDLFPRFERAGLLVDVVRTLRAQHDAGRRVTDAILRRATPHALADLPGRREMRLSLQAFARMYRPHASREDTVVFPALRSIVSRREWDDLGEAFEERERGLFGERGFERFVAEVAAVERGLGIHDLARYTPI